VLWIERSTLRTRERVRWTRPPQMERLPSLLMLSVQSQAWLAKLWPVSLP
jgi:hypothetical protein